MFRQIGLFFAVVVLYVDLICAQNEGKEEEEERDPDLMASTVFLILTLMVVASVMFEVTKDWILETTRKELLPVITSLYGELTVLGFIGLTLFIVGQLNLVDEISVSLFGEAEFITELCESVHMVLFLVVLIFMATVVGLIQVGNSIAESWKHWETDILDDVKLAAEYNAIKYKPQCDYKEPLEYQRIAYAAIRKHFLRDLPDDIADGFDFSGYLIPLLGSTLSEVVEIPVLTWVALEIFLFIVWQLKMHLTDFQIKCFLLAVSICLPVVMRCIQFKLRAIKADVLLATRSLMKMSNRDYQGDKLVGCATEATPLSRADSNNFVLNEGQVEIKAKCCAPFTCPQRYDSRNLATFYGRTTFDWKHHGGRFWLGNWNHPCNPIKDHKEAPEFTLFLVRLW